MIVFGVGEVCGCLFIGQMIDNYGSKMVSLINVAIVVLMTFVTLAFLGINQFNLLAFLMTFLWGVQDSTVSTHCFELCGFEFDNNTEPYSLFNLLQALGVFIFQIIESVIDTRIKYIVYASFIGLIGIYSCGVTYFFEFRNAKSQLDISVVLTQPGGTARPSSTYEANINEIEMKEIQQRRTIIIEMPDISDDVAA